MCAPPRTYASCSIFPGLAFRHCAPSDTIPGSTSARQPRLHCTSAATSWQPSPPSGGEDVRYRPASAAPLLTSLMGSILATSSWGSAEWPVALGDSLLAQRLGPFLRPHGSSLSCPRLPSTSWIRRPGSKAGSGMPFSPYAPEHLGASSDSSPLPPAYGTDSTWRITHLDGVVGVVRHGSLKAAVVASASSIRARTIPGGRIAAVHIDLRGPRCPLSPRSIGDMLGVSGGELTESPIDGFRFARGTRTRSARNSSDSRQTA